MNFRSRLLLLGCFILLLQVGMGYALYQYVIYPKVTTLEKNAVEKNLHRNIEWLQHALFNLSRTSQLLIELPLIQDLMHAHPKPLPASLQLQPLMIQQDLNFLALVNNDNKVLWENIIDLNTEKSYPIQTLIPLLWKYEPDFLSPLSSQRQKIGIYNSPIGPMLIATEDVFLNASPQARQGILVVGKLITIEMMQQMQNLTFSDIQLWPSEGNTLSAKNQNIIEQLSHTDSNFLAEENTALFRGYTALPDLNQSFQLLMSTTLTRDLNALIQISLIEILCILLIPQLLFLGILSFLIRYYVILPARKLIQQIDITENIWDPPALHIAPWNEVGLLTNAISNFISRQQFYVNQETTLAYRQGLYQARQDLFEGLEKILAPLMSGITNMEKKLSNLPINEIEWIIAESRTGQISAQHITKYAENLHTINEKLRRYRKETRARLYELHSKALRNTAVLRNQARDYTPTQPPTFISTFRIHLHNTHDIHDPDYRS